MMSWLRFVSDVTRVLVGIGIVCLCCRRLGGSRWESCKRMGDYDGALRWARWMSLGYPSARILCEQALTLCQAGRLAEAERYCRRGLARSREDSGAIHRRLLGVLRFALLDAGRYDEAERSFISAIRAGDQSGCGQSGLAEILLVQGVEPAKALGYATQAVDLSRHRAAGFAHWAHFANQAWALALLGRAEEAREALAQAINQSAPTASGNAERRWRIGMTLLAMQRTGEACTHFQLGKNADPRGKYGHRCADLLRKWQ